MIAPLKPKRTHIGISIVQILMGTVPPPSRQLRWGEDIPPVIWQALKNGETAILYGPDGQPRSWVIMDTTGTIREKRFAKQD